MKVLSSLALLLISNFVFAQKPQNGAMASLLIGRLYGKVIEAETKQPLAYASVTVFNKSDSLIGGSLVTENGDFNITGLPMGAFTVKATYMGYETWTKAVKLSAPNNIEEDLGNLTLAPDSRILNTVEITAQKATTTMSLEKRVFNVDKNLTSAGGTAEDVMKNVPSVTVDMDGNAKLRDRATTIYVDGKPTLLALSQIPADQIESVEVISNPSAKYEAATMGGILNLVLKKNRKPGYNGILSAGIGTQKRYNGMLNLNAHEGKWTLSSFYNLNAAAVPSNAYLYQTNRSADGIVQNYFNQNTTVLFANSFQTGRLSLEYAANNRNTFSLAGTISAGKFDITPVQNYEYLSPTRQRTSYGTRKTNPKNDFRNNNLEAQWTKTFAKKDKSLIVLGNYAWGNGINTASWTTTGFNNDGVVLPDYPELVRINGGNVNAQGVFQVDYVNPISDSSKLGMGLRSFWSARDQQFFYNPFSYETNLYVQDDQLSQDARVTENINAAYVTYSGRLKYQIEYQAGFRFEQSNLTGISHLGAAPNFGYDYPKGFGKDFLRAFFPSLYLAKKIDETTEIGLNFSRKIGRPGFRQLMPGIQANDKQNIQIGNPNLQPEFVNTAELNYNKTFGNSNWLSTMYITNETNTLKPLIRPSATDSSILVTSFANGLHELTYGIDNTLRFPVGKNLEVMLNVNVFEFNVVVDTFTNSNWTFNSKLNLTYHLPADISLQLNAGYDGNRPLPQGNRKAIGYLDFAVKKSFFNNAANMVFSINDVFNTRKDLSTFTQPTYVQEVMRRRDTRFFKLSIQIPFGKADASLFKRLREGKRPAGPEQPDFDGGG